MTTENPLGKAYDKRRKEFEEPLKTCTDETIKTGLVQGLITINLSLETLLILGHTRTDFLTGEMKEYNRIKDFQEEQAKRIEEIRRNSAQLTSPETRMQSQETAEILARSQASIADLLLQAADTRRKLVEFAAGQMEPKLAILLDQDDPVLMKEQLKELAKILIGLIPGIDTIISVLDAKDVLKASQKRYEAASEALTRLDTYMRDIFQWNLYCQLLIEHIRRIATHGNELTPPVDEMIQKASKSVMDRFQTILDAATTQ